MSPQGIEFFSFCLQQDIMMIIEQAHSLATNTPEAVGNNFSLFLARIEQ